MAPFTACKGIAYPLESADLPPLCVVARQGWVGHYKEWFVADHTVKTATCDAVRLR